MSKFSKWVINAFDALTPDIDNIYDNAKSHTLSEWRNIQKSLVSATGATAVAIPGFHVAGMAADVAFLMNRMSVCSYGIGAIMGYDEDRGNILEPEDFAFVLAKWSGVRGTEDAVIAKTSADLVAKVGSKEATKLLAKTMCKHAGILVGKKMGSKVGVKLGAKFGTKLGGKLAGGFIPVVGAIIGGGVNYWFISEVSGVAQQWYYQKLDL